MPVGWIVADLGETCEILDSRRSPINSSERNKRIEGKTDSELFPYYGATGEAGKIDGYLFDGEHVLIGEDAAPFLEPHRGVSYLVNGKFWVNNHAHILRHPTSNRFLCHYLRQVNYRPFVTGTTRLKLNQEQLRKIPIPLPPLNEQKRIVAKIEELFSELDAGEESLRRARRQLGVYRQSLLKQAFEGKLTEHWRKQNPHLLKSPDQLLKRIQAERLARYGEQLKEWEACGRAGRKPILPKEFEFISRDEADSLLNLPQGWTWVRFGNVLAIRSGDGLTASQMDGGKIPVYGGNGVSGFHGSYMFEDPKLVIGRVGAKCGITHITAPKSWVTDNALICEFQIQSADLVYMKLLLNHLDLNKLSVSTAQPVVSGSKLNPLPIPLCTLPEQHEIVRLLDEQFTVIEQNEREIDAALKRSAALRQSILKKAFTGQLVPQDPTDEPASALLERIRKEREALTAKPQKKKTDRKRVTCQKT